MFGASITVRLSLAHAHKQPNEVIRLFTDTLRSGGYPTEWLDGRINIGGFGDGE